MKIVVNHLSRRRFSGDVCGGEVTLNFLKEGKTVHEEVFKGKCLSNYVRVIKDFEYDCELLSADEATSFIYAIERSNKDD